MSNQYCKESLLRKQIIRFIVTGIINTLVYYLLYSLLIFMRIDYKIAVFLATAAGAFFSFATFRRYVFEHSSRYAMYKFLLLYTGLYVANVGLIYLFQKIVENYYISGFVATLCCAVLSFVLNKRYVFCRSQRRLP